MTLQGVEFTCCWPYAAWEAQPQGDRACLARGEVDSKSPGSEDDDGKGQEQEEEAAGPIGTRGAVVIGAVAGAVLDMVLETDEPLATLSSELSTVSAAAHVTLGVVSVFGLPVDASHQWRGRQYYIVHCRRPFALSRPQRSPFDVRPRSKQSWTPRRNL